MSTQGVDGVFFGPMDYSISAGVPLQGGHEKVISALKTVVAASKKYGKFVIFGAGFPQWEKALDVAKLGVQAIELGHDVSILKTVWTKTISAFENYSN